MPLHRLPVGRSLVGRPAKDFGRREDVLIRQGAGGVDAVHQDVGLRLHQKRPQGRAPEDLFGELSVQVVDELIPGRRVGEDLVPSSLPKVLRDEKVSPDGLHVGPGKLLPELPGRHFRLDPPQGAQDDPCGRLGQEASGHRPTHQPGTPEDENGRSVQLHDRLESLWSYSSDGCRPHPVPDGLRRDRRGPGPGGRKRLTPLRPPP